MVGVAVEQRAKQVFGPPQLGVGDLTFVVGAYRILLDRTYDKKIVLSMSLGVRVPLELDRIMRACIDLLAWS